MIASTNKVKDILKAAVMQISEVHGEREAAAVLYRLLDERFGITRTSLALDPAMTLGESQIVRLFKDLQKLKKGMPLQYVLGYAHFMGRRFMVRPGVLIPRPETEELVMAALAALPSNLPLNIVDIGTGSGAIPVTLKLRLPCASVSATDVDPVAIETARQNALALDVDVTFVQHDVLNEPWPFTGFWDAIVSNPPYIPRSGSPALQKCIRDYEPEAALFVDDDDPLVFYRTIGLLGIKWLKEEGLLLFECHDHYASAVAELLQGMHYASLQVLEDIHGKPRIVSARKDAAQN